MRKAQQFRDRHETIAPLAQPVKDEGERLHILPTGLDAPVVHQDDGARVDEFENPSRHRFGCRGIVVVGGDRPEDDSEATKLGGGVDAIVQVAARRSEQFRANARHPLNGVSTLDDFTADGVPIFAGQISGVRVGVVADFVPFGDDAARQIGVAFGAGADEKKGRPHPIAFEDVQNLRREHWVRSVIKGQGDDFGQGMLGVVPFPFRQHQRHPDCQQQ